MDEAERESHLNIYSELQLRNKLAEPEGQLHYEEISRDVNLANHNREELHYQRFNQKIFSLCQALKIIGKLPENSQFLLSVLRDLNYYDTSSRAKDGFNLRRLSENFTNTKSEEKNELRRPNLFFGQKKDENGWGV